MRQDEHGTAQGVMRRIASELVSEFSKIKCAGLSCTGLRWLEGGFEN